MNDVAIDIQGLGKRYRIGQRKVGSQTIVGAFTGWITRPLANLAELRRLTRFDAQGDDVLDALADISFQVREGEVVGLIGRNGAGKSTLLKILAQITDPSSGRAEIRGKVGSLLEVGTGFHPDLSGRENIYLNGTILGMRKVEIDRRFDDIVEFSGVSKFIDTAVKRYSSGMKVRLAFSVAAHLDADILLIDEVLAVGDAEFQARCLAKMDDVAHSGRTVVFVSHSMSAVRNLCTRGVVFERGALRFDGPIDAAVDHYLRSLEATAGAAIDSPERTGSGRARVVEAELEDEAGRPLSHPTSGRFMRIKLGFVSENPPATLDARISIYDEAGARIAMFDTRWTRGTLSPVPGRGTFACEIERLPLPLGRYRIATALLDGSDSVDHLPNALVFEVDTSLFFEAGKTLDSRQVATLIDHRWSSGEASRERA